MDGLVASRGVKAAVVRAFGRPLEIEQVELAAPGPDEVKVRVASVAICGSDLHACDGAWGGVTPVVYGHEAAGIVSGLGAGVTAAAMGDHVVVTLLRTCGRCFYCRHEQTHLCEGSCALDAESRLRDAAGEPIAQGIYVGAFAEELVVHRSQVVGIDRSIPLDAASLLACGVPTGFGAVTQTAAVPAGSSVVVVGVGGVGISCVQGARAAGGAPIIALDLSEAKLDVAPRFGATHTLRADAPNLIAAVAGLTEGRGADYVFVAAGSVAAIESSIDLVRPGGTLVVVGITAAGAQARFEMSEFASSGRRILGSKMGSTDAARDIPDLAGRYLAGTLELNALISGRFTLDNINDAMKLVRSGQALRNVIVFPGVGE
jgi:S-(hydroxymethyl)glutathione dehydrogenase/alcohol dehydrogenase